MTSRWNHNTAYHSELPAAAPGPDSKVLDVGSGDGLLVSKFAEVVHDVRGIDSDPHAVKQARALLATVPNATVILGDVFDAPELLGQQFDLITAVATLHHLPLEPALKRLAELLSPGGELFVIGIASNKTAADWFISGALVIPVRLMSKAHREEYYPGMKTSKPQKSLKEICDIAKIVLPGCRIQRRFYYRYTLRWTKPSGGFTNS